MHDVSATEAARRFSDLLDAVEHDRETFTIRRHGRTIARIVPASGTGRAVKALLRRAPPDDAWAEELRDLRRASPVQERAWSD